MNNSGFAFFLSEIQAATGNARPPTDAVCVEGDGALPSVFAVTDLAAAAIGAAAAAAADLVAQRHGARPAVWVDRRTASIWFQDQNVVKPQGWSLPPPWDPIAGDYEASDGWIRLHTNAPHHRSAALEVLGVEGTKAAVARAVVRWKKAELEAAVVANKGCAAAMHTQAEWASHAQGRAVAAEPLLAWEAGSAAPTPDWAIPRDRPLAGIRVLDLTRVLAGPVATRFLAGLGADVLRIDPPDWDEPAILPSIMVGKRAARLDLRSDAGRSVFVGLLQQADVLAHGYRAGALPGLGFGAAERQALCPGLVDVSHDAYGWSGPWQDRRGFDSLVQMSSGIADAGMRRLGKDRPFPLPVQALDHVCGYLVATAVLTGLLRRLETGRSWIARTSLARTAALLMAGPSGDPEARLASVTDDDYSPVVEATEWGPALRAKSPVVIAGAPVRWEFPARGLGTSNPKWVG